MGRLAIMLSVIVLSASNLSAQLKVYFIDVGQGDAIYIEFPGGKKALIDGGPNGKIVSDFLKAKGVAKLDYVALTHPHSDHYRGLKKVFNDFEVDNYYDTRAENRDAAGDNNLRELAEAEPGCRTHYPKPGDNLDWDSKVTVKVLNACFKPVVMHDNDETNNCSLVIRMYYNGNGILLTGDANSEIEADMMKYFKSGLQSNILKVAHHGSRTSTGDQFLARVRPDYAFISVGAGNVYAHPHKEALDRLKAAGAKIYMTMNSGTQSFTIPAEGKNGAFPVKPVINDTENVMVADKTTDTEQGPQTQTMAVTWSPEPLEISSEALGQLNRFSAEK